MVFSTLEFLFFYLTVTLLLYYLVPKKYLKARNLVLFITSLAFYGWSEPKLLILMILTIAIDYAGGLLIAHSGDNGKKRKAFLWTTVIINLGILCFFKYYNFLYGIVSSVVPLPASFDLKISLPIGISFYTFQSLSYVIDVYRGTAKVQKDPIAFGTYVTLFPQLVAGPIVRYHDVDMMLTSRTETTDKFASGVRRFIVGLSKKVLLSNMVAALFESFKAIPNDERTVVSAWMCVITYSLHIYFDFSGYSDMAIGLGRMFGFEFLENFNYPYIARSIKDFWDRWHISLSTWFREYLYYPLGGNRCSAVRHIFNLLVVWFATGLWHGANFNFIIWGLYYFVLLVIEKYLLKDVLKKLPEVFQHIYALFFIGIGWLIFAFEDMSAGLSLFGSMFGIGASGFISGNDLFDLLRNLPFLAVLVIGCTPLPRKIYGKLTEKKAFGIVFTVLSVVMLFLCVTYLVSSSFNPFIYTRF